MTPTESNLIDNALRWDGGPPARGLWDATEALRRERQLPSGEPRFEFKSTVGPVTSESKYYEDLLAIERQKRIEAERQLQYFQSYNRTWSKVISDWQRETFGDVDSVRAFIRTDEEWKELEDKVFEQSSPENLIEEVADVVICAAAFVASLGSDLALEVNRKMVINQYREWHSNGDGTGYHHKQTGCKCQEIPPVDPLF